MEQMKVIAHIKTDFKEKFGIPRQSGLVESRGEIIFEPEYRVREAFRGLEEFSHIWVLWQFSEAVRDSWSPTVRPPLLGGNKRVGVFATRSPFRPNSIGLSCVKLERVEYTKNFGPVLHVLGADILDGTPIYDIKPYLPYADSHPDAVGGFTENLSERKLSVSDPYGVLDIVPHDVRDTLIATLAHDPRPSYKGDESQYGMRYGDYEVKFSVEGNVLTVIEIAKV